MRVYFAPCGIGLGHVGRNVPIARKLQERNAEIMFSTYREGTSFIQKEKLPLFKAPPIGFQVKPDGTIDFRQTAVNTGPFLVYFTVLKQVTAEIKAMTEFKPDIIVSDSRISPLLAARFLRIPRICILNQFQVIIPRKKRFLRLAKLADFGTLTLVGKMWTSGNTVLIPDFPPPYTISIGNLNIPDSYRKNVRLIGPILPEKPDALPSKKELREKLGLPQEKPVIFAPISGPLRERAFLTSVLKRTLTEFPEDYEVVMSLGLPDANDKPVHYGNVTIFGWLPNRFEYLKACDVAIGRAGHGTITQCMCYGKPAILIPTPSHTEQLSNAKQAATIGVAKVIQQEKFSREKLLEKVKQILDSHMPEKLEQVQKEVMQYDGLEAATNVVFEIVKNK
jgi:UDP-N-acetylglucosamine--N-acetylmuramyl-(pentapeptide) pyrophosphoryl-undecaprenol N-acetylglucosamine transferase